jgi:hypothetical protein
MQVLRSFALRAAGMEKARSFATARPAYRAFYRLALISWLIVTPTALGFYGFAPTRSRLAGAEFFCQWKCLRYKDLNSVSGEFSYRMTALF